MASNIFKNLFGDDDVAQDEYYDDMPVQQPGRRNNVVSMDQAKQQAKRGNQLSQIALYEPRLYADVRQIAQQLLKGQAVIVNFTQMDDKNAKRVVDFLNGATYASCALPCSTKTEEHVGHGPYDHSKTHANGLDYRHA